jgi:uncharacterized protein (DUF1501 family)
MAPPLRDLARGRLLLSAALAAALAACAAPARQAGAESRASRALPEADPGARGTVQGARALEEAEQVAVRLGRAPDGRVVVLQVLSPALTPQQEEAIRGGLESGEWRREAPLTPSEESWIENVVRVRH